MDDYLNLARANMTSYETAMELTSYLNQERDYAPWTAASIALDYIDIMFYSLPDESKLKVRNPIIKGEEQSMYLTKPIFSTARTDVHGKFGKGSLRLRWL